MYFITFLILKKFKCCFGAECKANVLIKLEIIKKHACKAEVRLQIIRNSAIEGGSFLTPSCGFLHSGKNIYLLYFWMSGPCGHSARQEITRPKGVRLPDLFFITTAWRMLWTNLKKVTKIIIIIKLIIITIIRQWKLYKFKE